MQSLDQFDIIDGAQMMSPTLITILWLYLFCHYGNHLTEHFSRFGEAIYQLDWYMLPLDRQKNLPRALALADKPIYLEGFGGVECIRQLFTKVLKIHQTEMTSDLNLNYNCFQIMNTTGSYFMVLQRFD